MASMLPLTRGAYASAAKVLLLVVWSVAEPSTDTTCTEDVVLSHAAVSALQQNAGGYASQLSVAEESGNSVASLTSHVQTAANAAADSSLTLDEVAKQNENILAALRVLREKGEANDTTHLSKVDKTSLEGVINTITHTMFGNLNRLHQEDQAEVNSAHAAVVKCTTDRRTTLSGKVAAASLRLQAARDNHLRCRANESALVITKADKWFHCENMVRGNIAPSCPRWPATWTGMSSYFSSQDNSYYRFFLDKLAEYNYKKAAYESANSALSTTHLEANGLQTTFETNYCSYKGHEIDMCGTYVACRSDSLANYDVTKARVKHSEVSRKAYLKSGHAVICHVKAILGQGNKTHSQCEQELTDVDSTHLDMLLPSAPSADQCDFTSAAASSPCDSTFRSTEYGGLESNVHPATCSRCSWEALPQM